MAARHRQGWKYSGTYHDIYSDKVYNFYALTGAINGRDETGVAIIGKDLPNRL
jgi:hypothetical protein